MSNTIEIKIDGHRVKAESGQTIMEAAVKADIYIPRLCYLPEVPAHGSCRICTVMVNGRQQSACTSLCMEGAIVENETEALNEYRRNLVEMLFSEGNHFCMSCEKSGMCELQALGYRLGITSSRHVYFWPDRKLDASHPDILLDHNRCIQCGRCVQVSRDLDGKNIFQFCERGLERRIGVNSEANLKDTALEVTDAAVSVCPVGAILKKRVGYAMPMGTRPYDKVPIGTTIDKNTAEAAVH